MRRIALLSVVTCLAACGGSSSDPAPTTTGFLRVGNLAPDLAAVDFCVRATGTTAWGNPVMSGLGAAAGLVYDGGPTLEGTYQVSRYISYASGSYDIAVFNKADSLSTCANPVASLTGVSLGSTVHKLVALVGHAGASPNPVPYTLVQFVDETTVASGNVAIRFINAGLFPGGADKLPPINVGVTVATVYTPIFLNVAYPGVAPVKPTPLPAIDANGYASVPASQFTGAVNLTVCPYPLDPSTAPPGYCQSTALGTGSIQANKIATAMVIGYAGTAPNALLCGDNEPPPVLPAPAVWNYSMCTNKPVP